SELPAPILATSRSLSVSNELEALRVADSWPSSSTRSSEHEDATTTTSAAMGSLGMAALLVRYPPQSDALNCLGLDAVRLQTPRRRLAGRPRRRGGHGRLPGREGDEARRQPRAVRVRRGQRGDGARRPGVVLRHVSPEV